MMIFAAAPSEPSPAAAPSGPSPAAAPKRAQQLRPARAPGHDVGDAPGHSESKGARHAAAHVARRAGRNKEEPKPDLLNAIRDRQVIVDVGIVSQATRYRDCHQL